MALRRYALELRATCLMSHGPSPDAPVPFKIIMSAE